MAHRFRKISTETPVAVLTKDETGNIFPSIIEEDEEMVVENHTVVSDDTTVRLKRISKGSSVFNDSTRKISAPGRKLTIAERRASVLLPTIVSIPRTQSILDENNAGNTVVCKPRSITFVEKLPADNNASFLLTVWNMLPSLQGSAVFSMPYIVAIGGYAVLPCIVLMSIMSAFTCNLIVDCLYEVSPRSQNLKRVRKNFTDIAQKVWGELGARIVTLLLVFYLYTGSIVNIVVVSNSVYAVLKPHIDLSFTAMMCILSLLAYPTLFITKLTTLAYLSCMAVVSLIIGFISILYVFIQESSAWSVHMKTLPWFKLEMFPLATSIILFSCTVHNVVPQVEGSMRERSKFPRVVYLSYACSCVVKGVVGVLGVLTFGINTQSIVSLNAGDVNPHVRVLCTIAISIYALFTYPLVMFIVCDFVDSLVENTKITDLNNYFYPWVGITRFLLLAVSVLIAWLVPYFSIILGIRGSFLGSLFGYVFPCYFHLKLKWERLSLLSKITDVIIIILGAAAGSLGMFSTIDKLLALLKTNQ